MPDGLKRMKSSDRAMQYIRALVHGDSGIGKTTSLRTLPEKGTLIAVSERNLIPLRAKNYEAVQITSYGELQALCKAVNGGEFPDLKVLAIDSLTVISRLLKEHIVRELRPRVITERTKGKSSKPDAIYDDQLTQEDWGVYGVKLSAFLGWLANVPHHVVVTSLSEWKENKQTGEVLKTPILNGKTQSECAAYFDLVFHMESVKTEKGEARVWRTANDGQVIAKDATGVLDKLEPSDWTELFKKILNGSK